MDTKDLCEHTRIRLIAAAIGHQQCTKTESNIIPLPGTDRVIAIGTPAQVCALLANNVAQDAVDAAITDAMLHGTGAFRVVVDPAMPPDRMRLVSGEHAITVTNIGYCDLVDSEGGHHD